MHIRIDQVIDNVVVTHFFNFQTEDWRDIYGVKIECHDKIEKLTKIANDDDRIKIKPVVKKLSNFQKELARQLKIEHKARRKTKSNTFLQRILQHHIG